MSDLRFTHRKQQPLSAIIAAAVATEPTCLMCRPIHERKASSDCPKLEAKG